QDLADLAVCLGPLRGRQLEISRDGRYLANVVASTHREAPLVLEMLNVREPLGPLELRSWPLHGVVRWRPIWRWNLVARQERGPGRADCFPHGRISQQVWSTKRGKHAARLQ